MRLRLSYDGGTTWTSYINTASSSWTTTISDHIAGGQTNKWGRDWTRDEIVNNLRVQANWIGSTSGRLTYLPVKIYYTESVDTTPPVITLSGSSSVIVEAGFFVYTDAGATALDNYDSDLNSSIVTGGLPINTNIIGPHTVTYDVTDSNGNAAIRVTRTVIVTHTLPTVRYISGTVIDSAPAHTPLAGVTVSTTGFTSVTQDIELELKPTGDITGSVTDG